MASGNTLCTFLPSDNRPPTSNPATLDTRNGHDVLDFDGSTDEEAIFTGVLPRHYSGGGLTITSHWTATSATSGSFRVQMDIERCADGGTDLDSDSFTGSFQSAGGTANGTSGVMDYVAVTFTDGAQMDSLAVGETFRLKVRRDADGTSGTDDITTDLELHAIEIKET